MSTFGGWRCDGCGLEDRDNGYPGFPPDGWVRLSARTFGHLEARADYCPRCARAVDIITLALGAPVVVQPKGATPRRKANGTTDPDPVPVPDLFDEDGA